MSVEFGTLKYRSNQVVRSVQYEAHIWFLALDVCEILGLTDTSQSVKRLNDGDKQKIKVQLSGIRRVAWFLNESGVYHLTATSTKPGAKKFRKWIREQVVPKQSGKVLSQLGKI